MSDFIRTMQMLDRGKVKYTCGDRTITLTDQPESYQYIEQGVRLVFNEYGHIVSVDFIRR